MFGLFEHWVQDLDMDIGQEAKPVKPVKEANK